MHYNVNKKDNFYILKYFLKKIIEVSLLSVLKYIQEIKKNNSE